MIIFDLDGTLFMTHETTSPVLYEMCKRYGFTVTKEDEDFLLYTTVGAFLDRVANGMSEAERNAFEAEFDVLELASVKKCGRLYPNAKELLQRLKDSGHTLAICGMGSSEYIETVCKRCDIRSFFSHVYCRTNNNTKTEALHNLIHDTNTDPNECIMIGDSIIDITAARANSITFIGVTYGYGKEQILCADYVANDISEVEKCIRTALPERICTHKN